MLMEGGQFHIAGDIVGNLFLTADALKQKRVEDERRRLEALEEAKREEERRRRHYVFKQRVKVVEEQVERWERAERVRGYLRAAEEAFAGGTFSAEVSPNVEAWLDWMRRYAEGIDPLSELAEAATKGMHVEDPPSWGW